MIGYAGEGSGGDGLKGAPPSVFKAAQQQARVGVDVRGVTGSGSTLPSRCMPTCTLCYLRQQQQPQQQQPQQQQPQQQHMPSCSRLSRL